MPPMYTLYRLSLGLLSGDGTKLGDPAAASMTCECLWCLQLRDEELSKELQESNWFSAPSALRVYGQYLNLDKDRNGMLSKQELAR